MTFFQIMQNKLHFAVTGMTAAELIAARSDHAQPNMGLTSWKRGRVAKAAEQHIVDATAPPVDNSTTTNRVQEPPGRDFRAKIGKPSLP
jgi:hypothetical protein